VKLAEDERHFRLDVRYQYDNPATPTPVEVLKPVQEYFLNIVESTTSLANVQCSLKDPLPRRTHSLGHLLQQQPVKRYTQDESCAFVVYHSREPI
jgi:hypothetical protein